VKFHVGQRVRIVKSHYGNDGKLATVTGEASGFFAEDGSRFAGYTIDIDGVGERGPFGRVAARPEWLEPLRDDDTNTVTTWSACVWQPKALQVRA
jgi:hypothetical protein